MDKLRLRFEKTGRAVYISHLDLMHTMQRVFLRAGVPLKYSEGFNPHPLISILLPLSVGCGSVCELMDFRLHDDADLESLAERLNSAMPEGVRVTEVYEAQRKSRELKWLRVTGRLEYDNADTAEAAEKLRELYAGEIVITKRTKRGEGDFNLSAGIREISFDAADGMVLVTAVVSAQEPTVNPELIAEAVRQKMPGFAPDFAAFRREETYDGEMEIFR
ncbi:MAG: TIGR03936 family radical SAM-associated protein [Candidatus Heteroscillospira sp.]|jgi:radical SAM-linked protein